MERVERGLHDPVARLRTLDRLAGVRGSGSGEAVVELGVPHGQGGRAGGGQLRGDARDERCPLVRSLLAGGVQVRGVHVDRPVQRRQCSEIAREEPVEGGRQAHRRAGRHDERLRILLLDDVVGPLGHVGELLGSAVPEHREARLVPDLVGADPPGVATHHGGHERIPGGHALGRRGGSRNGIVAGTRARRIPRRRAAEHEQDVGDAVAVRHLQRRVEGLPVVDALDRLDLRPVRPGIPQAQRAEGHVVVGPGAVLHACHVQPGDRRRHDLADPGSGGCRGRRCRGAGRRRCRGAGGPGGRGGHGGRGRRRVLGRAGGAGCQGERRRGQERQEGAADHLRRLRAARRGSVFASGNP